jgi:hypothetical protein
MVRRGWAEGKRFVLPSGLSIGCSITLQSWIVKKAYGRNGRNMCIAVWRKGADRVIERKRKRTSKSPPVILTSRSGIHCPQLRGPLWIHRRVRCDRSILKVSCCFARERSSRNVRRESQTRISQHSHTAAAQTGLILIHSVYG